MRGILTASVAAVTIGLLTVSLSAAPTTPAAKPNATPLTQLAQYGGYGYGGGYGGGYHHYCHNYCEGYGYYRHCYQVC